MDERQMQRVGFVFLQTMFMRKISGVDEYFS